MQREPQLAQYYGVDAVPVMIYLNRNGVSVARHEGYSDDPARVSFLKRLRTQERATEFGPPRL